MDEQNRLRLFIIIFAFLALCLSLFIEPGLPLPDPGRLFDLFMDPLKR